MNTVHSQSADFESDGDVPVSREPGDARSMRAMQHSATGQVNPDVGNGLPSHEAKSGVDGRPKASQARASCGCSREGRNLVVCIDGTSNQFGQKNTNVIELYSLIQKDEEDNQLTWYNSGIGTYAKPSWKSLTWYKKVLWHKIDLAIAWNFENILLDAYRWLSETYKKGDRIFLFGFSRGAYQIRTLSAMIDKVGLIHRGNEKQIPFAFQLYADPDSGKAAPDMDVEDPVNDNISTADTFKNTFSRVVKVHFVGAWDTVSSIGIVRSSKLLPGTIDGMKHVCHFRHALALDERRVKFLPEYAYGGASQESSESDSRELVHTKEVWFAGTHSDIGGGIEANARLNRTRPSLRWMYLEASSAGLRLIPFKRGVKDDRVIKVNESLTWLWRPLEVFPLRRLRYTANNERKDTTHWPHLGGVRIIQKGQKIHPSVWRLDFEDTKPVYTPRARLFSREDFWKTLQQGQTRADGTETNPWKEVDFYDMLENLVKSYTSSDSEELGDDTQRTQLETMRMIAQSEGGRRVLSRVLFDHLQERHIPVAILCNVLEVLMKTSDVRYQLPHQETRSRLSRHLDGASNEHHQICRRFLADFTDRTLRTVHFDQSVCSVAYSHDTKYIVCGLFIGEISICDAQTGAVEKTLKTNDDVVCSVVFSPDNKLVASGSDDGTIIIWDVETGQAVGKPYRHSDGVWSVAFSRDGQRIVSGSDDRTLRIWDVKTGQSVGKPLKGHTYFFSVAFSPDGTRVASGSADKTVRIWDAETGQVVGIPLEGHADWVRSVTFSPDGQHIVSGSDDGTIRIWDVEKGQMVGEALKGHTNYVRSVAVSPDGKYIVSGSDDRTVRIWDLETRQMVGKPYKGHTDWVRSVTFSPDGTHVVSGSDDRTIRIWDVLEPLQPLPSETEVEAENAEAGRSHTVSPPDDPSTVQSV